MTPASINAVYEAVRDIVNKDQQGQITPTTFNQFAQVAQLDVVNELIELKNDYYRNGLRWRSRRGGINDIQQIDDMLSLIYRDAMPLTGTGQVYDFPSSVMSVELVIADNKAVDISTAQAFAYASRNGSLQGVTPNTSMIKPSPSFMMCKRIDNRQLFFEPAPVSNVLASYLKEPQSVDSGGNPSTQQPTWVGALPFPGAPYEVFDAVNSTNFEIGVQAQNMLIMKILQYLGVNLTHEIALQYGLQEEQQDDQQANS